MNKLFLVTSNLGSVFEDPVIRERWYTEFEKVVASVDPDIVALHCQEIGGKDFETGMLRVEEFVRKLRLLSCFREFDRVRSYMDTDHHDTSEFTALGNVYLIHQRLPAISQWNFQTNDFHEVVGEKVVFKALPSCLELSNDHFHQKDRYPNDYFPGVRWTRKGLLHTRWKLSDGTIINFCNIHLFHDDDNLIALEQSPSIYSQYRKRALRHAQETISRGMSSSDEPLFLFGDFNFRLDLSSVVKHMTTTDHQSQLIRAEDGSLQKIVYRNAISVDDDDMLSIESKKFHVRDQSQFLTHYHELLPFDHELESFEKLTELPVCFQPSYPFSEEISEGCKYMDKRCPAWCDRVLMNRSAKQLVEASPVNAQYEMMAKEACVGDHKMIFLLFAVKGLPLASLSTTEQHHQQSKEDNQDHPEGEPVSTTAGADIVSHETTQCATAAQEGRSEPQKSSCTLL